MYGEDFLEQKPYKSLISQPKELFFQYTYIRNVVTKIIT